MWLVLLLISSIVPVLLVWKFGYKVASLATIGVGLILIFVAVPLIVRFVDDLLLPGWIMIIGALMLVIGLLVLFVGFVHRKTRRSQ
jgi:divalent metal cation (Fe/Co/Zn/Cd) transporter